MNQRQNLLERLIASQAAFRRQFQAAVPPSLQNEFAEFGGITVQQMEVVRRLLREERVTMSDVAAAQGIGPSGATQLVDRLERRGLVTRVRDDHDRRVQYVVPTDRARAIARRLKTGIRRAATGWLKALDDRELETYVELTERIAAASRQTSPARPRRSDP